MLADFAAADWGFDNEVWKKLRRSQVRHRDAKILEKAAEIVWQYEPFLPPLQTESPHDKEGVYPSRGALEWVAKKIRELFPSQRYRPKDLELILFARELAWHFFGLTQRPLYEYVGRVLLAAFPEKWKPAGDVREAAKKLVKAGNGAEEDLGYMAELLVGHLFHTTRMAENYWGKKGKTQKSRGTRDKPRATSAAGTAKIRSS